MYPYSAPSGQISDGYPNPRVKLPSLVTDALDFYVELARTWSSSAPWRRVPISRGVAGLGACMYAAECCSVFAMDKSKSVISLEPKERRTNLSVGRVKP
jgi:hypothetical protein